MAPPGDNFLSLRQRGDRFPTALPRECVHRNGCKAVQIQLRRDAVLRVLVNDHQGQLLAIFGDRGVVISLVLQPKKFETHRLHDSFVPVRFQGARASEDHLPGFKAVQDARGKIAEKRQGVSRNAASDGSGHSPRTNTGPP